MMIKESPVHIQIKQFQNNGKYASKTLTIRYLGNYDETYLRIQHLYEILRENKGKGYVTVKHLT